MEKGRIGPIGEIAAPFCPKEAEIRRWRDDENFANLHPFIVDYAQPNLSITRK